MHIVFHDEAGTQEARVTHLPALILDLALLLAMAALATIVCRRIKQPLVLGYVIAGFLIGPSIDWFPDVTDSSSITTWSEIGVIFLMFGLGLEFSIVRLSTVGRPAFITAITEMLLMVVAGWVCGTLLGWSFFTSLFLGGMLAISSTTIIIKAFDDLGMKGKGFTELVFGALVVEDIMGIFLMVVLSTVAVGSAIDGGAVFVELGQMALYLVAWFALSVIVVPAALSRVAHVLTEEILLIVSIALCLVMVALANSIGFSSALGAFLAGSILAGTIQANTIEKLFKPIKDLFGAVFFVSVGMMLSPDSIAENLSAILAITLVTLIGKPVFTCLGAFVSGESLKTSLKCGMSLSQIGEFSFIIASLGASLGVTSGFLYPVIVAVSVVTTLTTPFYIKSSDGLYRLIVKLLPQRALDSLKKRYEHITEESEATSSLWGDHLKRWLLKIGLVVLVGLSSTEILIKTAVPFLSRFISSDFLTVGAMTLCIMIMGPFIANFFYSTRKNEFGALWLIGRKNRIILSLLVVVGGIVCLGIVVYVVAVSSANDLIWPYMFAVLLAAVLAQSKTVHSWFIHLETSFIANLNESILAERRESLSDEDHVNWVEKQLYVTEVEASRMLKRRTTENPAARMIHLVTPGETPDTTRTVVHSEDFVYGIAFGLELLCIERDGERIAGRTLASLEKEDLLRRINDPDDPLCIREGDILTFLGTEDEVDTYLQNLVKDGVIDEDDATSMTLEEYLVDHPNATDAVCYSFELDYDSPYAGKTIADVDFKSLYGSLVVALEHNWLLRMKPPTHTRLIAGDRIWLVGKSDLADPLIEKADAQILDQVTS